MGVWRMRPVPVHQGSLDCWAAAISSWSQVTSGIPDWTSPGKVRDAFKANGLGGHIQADGTLDVVPGMKAFADKFGLKIEEVVLGAAVPDGSVSHSTALDLGPDQIQPKLKKSHVLVVPGAASTTSMSHVVVVYGADRFTICFMDPLIDPATHVRKNWTSASYEDFGAPADRYLMVWKG